MMSYIVIVLGWLSIVGVVVRWSRGERRRIEREHAVSEIMDS